MRYAPIPRPFVPLLVATMVALAGTGLQAQDRALAEHPGYANLDAIFGSVRAEPNVEVYVQGALLRLAAEATRREDAELADMLLGMRAIRVLGYNVDELSSDETERLRDLARSLSVELEGLGWDVVARVRDEDERVHVYMRDIDDVIEGLVVMAIDDEEAIFVNITGTLDPAQIGRVGSRFDIDVLEDIEITN